ARRRHRREGMGGGSRRVECRHPPYGCIIPDDPNRRIPMIARGARRFGALAATVLFGLAVFLGSVLAAGDPDPRPSPEPKSGGAKAGNQKRGPKKKKKHAPEPQQAQLINGYTAPR